MRTLVILGALAAVPASSVAAQQGAANPHVGRVGTSTGYATRFVSASPRPGDTLTAGDTINLSVTIDYTLEVTSQGILALVLQRPSGGPLIRRHRQVMIPIDRGSGRKTLEDRFVVPADAPGIHLFVPLGPEGHPETSGDLVIRYFIRQRP